MGISGVLVWMIAAWTAGNVMAAPGADDKKMVRAQQDQIQRLQQAKQTLEQDNSRLTAANLDQGKQLRAVRAELLKIRVQVRESVAAQSELTAMSAEKALLTKRLEESLLAFDALQKKADSDARQASALLAQTRAAAVAAAQKTEQAAARQAASDRELLTKVQADLNARVASLSSCENSNAKLYKLNTDLLAMYEKTATARSLTSGGIFTQIERVKIENEVTTYQDQLGELKITPQSKPQY